MKRWREATKKKNHQELGLDEVDVVPAELGWR